MSNANLATTFFAAGGSEKLSVVDIYSQYNNSVTNNLPNSDKILNNPIISSFLPNKNSSSLPMVTGAIGNGLKINSQAIVDGILSVSTGVMGAFKSLPKPMQDMILKATGQNKIKLTVAGVTNYINAADLTTVTGIASMIKGITGCNLPINILDSRGSAIIGSNVIRQANAIGMLGAYDAFIQCLGDKLIGKEITALLLPHVVASSSVDLLSSIANGAHASDVTSTMPNLIQEFANKFKLPAGTTANKYVPMITATLGAFGKINSNWNKTPAATPSLGGITSPSPDFVKLVNQGLSANRYDVSQSANITSQVSNETVLLSVIKANSINKDIMSSVAESLSANFSYVSL